VLAFDFLNIFERHGITFLTGVPDSFLGAFCDEVYRRYGNDPAHHVVAHNEGGAVGLAAGAYLTTGKMPCVYLQNSGIGNIVNPVASLTNPGVYDIPILYVVGWRGQLGLEDEPQHIFQGAITKELLSVIGIKTLIVGKDTSDTELVRFLAENSNKSVALLIEKDAITGTKANYSNDYTIIREEAIKRIAQVDGVIVSSTGKISRELYETGRKNVFLTVGSMGHDSMIALGIALQRPNQKVWCLQGDGAFLMHLGACAEIGSIAPENYRYIVLNNAAHESVGGIPTCARNIDIAGIAEKCGFNRTCKVATLNELDTALSNDCSFIEVLCSLGSRSDLGRPEMPPSNNKFELMKTLGAKS
jgi:phosphonopyruvate decarboxylase